MLAFLPLVLTLQGAAPVPDTGRRAPRRAPVTDALRASAFKDVRAKDLLERARVARLQQDSLLLSYDATAYQRISVGLGVKAFSRSRLLFRHEEATHVQWQRGRGAWVELKGRRTALPMSKEGERDADADMGNISQLPYFPGREDLWVGGGGLVRAQVDEREIVHPIAEGAEAYYTYETGDSVLMTLPDGKRIVLRELRIAARQPRWNVTVGSFWFDQESAHLVRAVYRLSAPMDIWAVATQDNPNAMKDVPLLVKPMITPMRAELSAVTVEYGLYNQRFWLPRIETLDAVGYVSFMRAPVTMEERYSYASVNGIDSLPKVPDPRDARVSVLRDSLRKAETPAPLRDSLMRAAGKEARAATTRLKADQCAASGTYTTIHSQYNGAVRMAIRTPCDTSKLHNAPELPGSIYDANEQLFGAAERDDLIKSLGFGLQAGWSPQRPTLAYGLALTRYNRVEGLSSAVTLESVLGKGYTATLGARGGLGDRQLNGDFTLSRSNGRATVRGTVYRRLEVSTDWGSPLSFGSSLASLLYGRDEGAYFRTWGAELGGTSRQLGSLEWRVFAEQEWTADVNSRWTLFGGGNDLRFIGNPAAQRAKEYGAALRVQSSVGLDPAAWRLLSDVRIEGAGGDFGYGRGLVDETISHSIGSTLSAAVTTSVGYSVGTVPAQRRFYLGGLRSVRGQTALTEAGDAFWMTRTELGANSSGARPVIFADIGWAGDRRDWSKPGRPMSGVGTGASFVDGLFRVDLSRGLYPAKQWRLDFSLEARF
jgi:hemolysin secretion/activation protein ShlB/FhaC/HecB